ncbi:MAG: DUF58 domain-containing protein [Actinomycetales bacterium]|nr:DUF58 domain-containing protein [Actinomycetales bacterium]
MRLTGRGARLLVAALGLYGVGEGLGWALFRALGGVAVGVVAMGLLMTSRGFAASVTRSVYPEHVARDEAALARLVIKNGRRHRMAGFVARDPVGDRHVDVAVQGLRAGSTVTRTYALPTGRRGRLTVGPLTLIRQDPLGLALKRATAGETATLWVHPRVHPARPLPVGRARNYAGIAVDGPPRGSMDFRSLREYVVGDEPRHLHWKSTARTGQLMVREFLDPQQPRLVVLLDTRAEALDPRAFEEAVEVAASLVRASTDHGHPTRLRTTGGVDADTAVGMTVRDLMDRLAEVEQTEGGQRALSQDLTAGEGPGTTLVVVTGRLDQADLVEIAASRRRLDRVVVADLDAARQQGEVSGLLVIRDRDAAAAVHTWNAVVTL